MRRLVKGVLIAAGTVAGVVGMAALLLFPHTSPGLIHVKTRIIGARLVYAPLAHEDARWEVVLVGVRSGDSAWLRVAADLKPVLDTHPGEEMLGAVSSVLDVNPIGAVRILLPIYRSDIVCGQDEEGVTIDRTRAARREHLLQGLGSTEIGPCLEAVKQAQRPERAG